jgi:serine/threonine protein phosphatase PrpC
MSQKAEHPPVPPRPLTAEIDVFGLTHQGKVRKTNADHFLIASFHRTLRVHGTSLNSGDIGPRESESRGFIGLVADGVGTMSGAAEGSAQALNAFTQQLLHASEICSNMALTDRNAAVEELTRAVGAAHKALKDNAEREGLPPAATTLSMWAAFWPFAFVVHVGDSRVYRLTGDKFDRLTTDQTMAQMMVEAGAMSQTDAERSNLKHVLWSAVGAAEAVPEVTVHNASAQDRVLICSDGLTKHVSDDEIRDHMAKNISSEKLCHALVDLVLERGASDNVTVLSGRLRQG